MNIEPTTNTVTLCMLVHSTYHGKVRIFFSKFLNRSFLEDTVVCRDNRQATEMKTSNFRARKASETFGSHYSHKTMQK